MKSCDILSKPLNFAMVSMIIIIVSGFLTSCQVTYIVRENGEYLNHQYHLPCGMMVDQLKGQGNTKFFLVQKISATEEMEVNPVGLKIKRNGKPVNFELLHEQSGQWLKVTQPMNVQGEQEWSANFRLDSGVYNGDTLVVSFKDYVRCNSKPVPMDNLFFYFIHGGINFY